MRLWKLIKPKIVHILSLFILLLVSTIISQTIKILFFINMW